MRLRRRRRLRRFLVTAIIDGRPYSHAVLAHDALEAEDLAMPALEARALAERLRRLERLPDET